MSVDKVLGHYATCRLLQARRLKTILLVHQTQIKTNNYPSCEIDGKMKSVGSLLNTGSPDEARCVVLKWKNALVETASDNCVMKKINKKEVVHDNSGFGN